MMTTQVPPGSINAPVRVRLTQEQFEERSQELAAKVLHIEELRERKKIASKMAATIERAKGEDPRELRARIARLEAELKQKPLMLRPGKVIEVPILKDAQVKRLEAAVDRLRDGMTIFLKRSAHLADQLAQRQQVVATEAGTLRDQIKAAFGTAAARDQQAHGATLNRGAGRLQPPTSTLPAPARSAAAPSSSNAENGLGGGERRILIAVAQHSEGVTRQQLTVLTGYKRSSRDTYLQRLRSAGFIHENDFGIKAQPAGIVALGDDFRPLPTGQSLREHWLRTLPKGEAYILGRVVAAFPGSLPRDEIDGYKRSARDTYIQRLTARQLVQSAGSGAIRAAEVLFG
jgi:hypothetical protein